MNFLPPVLAAGTAELAPLFIELGLIFFALALLGRVAYRIGISPIPLFLIAGMVFGTQNLLPVEFSKPFIEAGAEIGVVFLLFMLGLEYSGKELLDNMQRSVGAGVVDLVMNFSPGVIFGLLMGWDIVLALLLGGITYISSSGIISKLLSDVGWLGNRETPVILSTLIFEDLVMAIYLPLMTVLLVGAGIVSGLISLGIALLTVVILAGVALRFSEPISNFVEHRSDEIVLLAVLGLMLLVGGVAQRLDVSAAVGAFLVGIALSKQLSEHVHHLVTPLKDMFAAVFFVFFGLQMNPADLPGVLPLALLLALVTGTTKFLSASWAARRAGISWRGQARAGTMLITRGEFSIVIAGLATSSANVDGSALATLTAAYVLLMAVAGPLLVKVIMPVLDKIEQIPLARRVIGLPPLRDDAPVPRPTPQPITSQVDSADL